MSSVPEASQQHPPLQLCVFDQRRGDQEGQEDDKVLAYYPSTVPTPSQTATVGLAQTFLNFTSTFDSDEACDSIWTSKGRWVLHNCEPHIWLLLIASNEWLKARSAHSSLVSCLHQLHHLITLLHGPLQQLLKQDATAGLARKAIVPVLTEYGSQLNKARNTEYLKLVNPLSLCGAIPLVRLPQPVLSRVQSVVHILEMLPIWNGNSTVGVLALYDHRLLYSSLKKEDTLAVWQLASHAFVPAAKAGKQQSMASIWGGSGKAAAPTSLLHKSAWTLNSKGLVVRSHPLPQPDRRSSAESLSSSTTPDSEELLPTPSVWLNGRKEWCCLVVWNVGDMLIILALPEKLPVTSSVAEACTAACAEDLKTLNHLVGHHLQAVRNFHVPSFRYMQTDELTDSIRTSPGSKVATLSKQSLSLTSNVRTLVEDRSRYHEDAYLEVAVWGHNDCWVVAKCQGKRRLLVVLEQRGNEGLLETCKAADGFAAIQFPGMFD